MAKDIPCEPSENVPNVHDDSARTLKSDNVPKLLRSGRATRSAGPSVTLRYNRCYLKL